MSHSRHSVNGKKVEDMIVKELQAELKKRSASTSGRKSDLYQRLVGLMDDEAAQQAKEAPQEEDKHAEETAETTVTTEESEEPAVKENVEDDKQEEDAAPIRQEEEDAATRSEEAVEEKQMEEEVKPQQHEETTSKPDEMEEEREHRKRKLEDEPQSKESESVQDEAPTGTTTDAAELNGEVAHAVPTDGQAAASKRQKLGEEAAAQERGRRLFGNALPTREERVSDDAQPRRKEREGERQRELEKPAKPQPSVETASSSSSPSAATISSGKEDVRKVVVQRRASQTDLDEEQPRVKAVDSVPAPTGEPTNTLLVRNFVRPFTLKAVKDLLAETGTVTNFWMNDIKTHCYVSYESVEQASVTRDAIYGLIWPVGNTSKPLVADFASPEELESKAPPRVNEKAAVNTTEARGRDRERGGKAAEPQRRQKPAPEPAGPTLDDLFRKTKAKPPIYFMPLSDEEVAQKEKEKEEKERLEKERLQKEREEREERERKRRRGRSRSRSRSRRRRSPSSSRSRSRSPSSSRSRSPSRSRSRSYSSRSSSRSPSRGR